MFSSFTGSFQAGKRAGLVEPYTANIVQSSLFAHYESSYVDSYPGSGTSWYSLEGLSTDVATLKNGTAYSLDNNGVFILDGIDDYISIPDNYAIRGNINTAVTVQLWVRVSSYNDKDRLIEKVTSGAGYSVQIRGTNQLALAMDGNLSNDYVIDGPSFAMNTWHFVTAVIAFNGKSTTPSKVYLNADEIISINNTESSIGTNSSELKINAGQVSGSREPVSKVGAVYVYTKALSAAEVEENFNATKGRFGL